MSSDERDDRSDEREVSSMRVISFQILIPKALQMMSMTHVAPKAMKIQMIVGIGQQKRDPSKSN